MSVFMLSFCISTSARSSSFQAQRTFTIARVASGAFDSGITIRTNVDHADAPSIFAASRIPVGMVTK